jgi:hypothetical protein
VKRIVIEVSLGNETMQTSADVGEAVNRAMVGIDALNIFEPMTPDATGVVTDMNGNSVGTWKVIP